MGKCVTLERVHPDYLTWKTRRLLSRCSYGDSGVLSDLIMEPDIASYGPRDCVYMLFEDGKLLGWGMRYHKEFMLYIYKKYRRKKWGSFLYKEARKDFGKRPPVVYSEHADEAKHFWRSHNRAKRHYVDREWWN